MFVCSVCASEHDIQLLERRLEAAYRTVCNACELDARGTIGERMWVSIGNGVMIGFVWKLLVQNTTLVVSFTRRPSMANANGGSTLGF